MFAASKSFLHNPEVGLLSWSFS